MYNKSEQITTQELWAKLFQAPSINMFLSENGRLCELPRFSDYITELCRARDEKPGSIIKRADIESSYGHRIFSGERNPSRDTILQLAFGFQMDVEEAQQLLKIGQSAMLHPKVKRDAIIAFCLFHKMSLIDTQLALEKNHLPLIGGRSHG